MAFSKLLVAAVATLSLAPSALAIPHRARSLHAHIAQIQARSWDGNNTYWENYTEYHLRYNALDCKHKHDTDFFTLCCGPLRAGVPLSSRPPECDPANNNNSTSVAIPALNSTITNTTDTLPSVNPGNSTSSSDASGDTMYLPSNDDDCTDDDSADNSSDDSSSSTTTLNDPPKTTAAPKTTTTTTTTTTHKTTTTTTEKPAPTSNDDGDDSGSDGGDAVHTIADGTITFFNQQGGTGACGQRHKDDEFGVALPQSLYGNMNEVSKYCGHKVTITYGDKSVSGKVWDACPPCAGDHLDLSVAFFNAFLDPDVGERSGMKIELF